MLSPLGPPETQSDLELQMGRIVFKLQLDRIVEKERKAYQTDNAPQGACLIQVPDHLPYFYSDLTPAAARAAASQVRASYRFKFGGRR